MTFIEEVVRYLRGAAGSAFGDDGSDAGCKIFGDFAPQIDFPYAVVYEITEHLSFMTKAGGYISAIADGTLQCDVFAGDRQQVHQLGEAVANALDDSESRLSPLEGPVMMIRVMAAQTIPDAGQGPDGSALVFRRFLTIHYQQQRTLGNA